MTDKQNKISFFKTISTKRYLAIVFFCALLVGSKQMIAQDENIHYKNRICLGLGGEDGFLGIDYSRDIFKSKLFLGIGCGIGTGWTGYIRYEPISYYGLRPFMSSGISHSFGGTLIASPGTSVFSASTGLNYLPKLKWATIPIIGIGITYYSILIGKTEGGINGFGPLIKIGVAFPNHKNKTI